MYARCASTSCFNAAAYWVAGIPMCGGHHADVVDRLRVVERTTVVKEIIRPLPDRLVYYAARGDRIKIGCTSDLKQRWTALRQPNVLAVEPGDFKLERARHREFGSIREEGEWFRRCAWLDEHMSALRKEHRELTVYWDQRLAA